MGRTRKSSPGPKAQTTKIKLAPNVIKESIKKEPVTFFQSDKPRGYSAGAQR